ncbi:methyltransferase [Nonomuraea sp. NPDC059007]|uniref:methyltransferase n=1 Tax=Nonomuraea sp. NPDC059007 TaxID=3346692 RepID=UPI00368529DA
MTTDSEITRPASPQDIFRLGTAFCTSKILLTAIELGLFTGLDAGPATEQQLRESHGLHPRASKAFLDALVALGVLTRQDGRYANGPTAGRHLVRGKPSYIGGFLERADRMLYPAWGHFTEALLSGEPQVGSDFQAMTRDPAKLAGFLGMMDSLNGLLAPELAGAFPWDACASVADIGGARGNLVGNLVKRRPHLKGLVFDLPQMEPAFDDHMAALGVDGQVSFVAGDFFADPLPEADALIIGHVLHDWSEQERRMLVGKAFEAVSPGGALLVYDRMVEEEPTDPDNLVISLDMLLTTPGGAEYTPGACGSWLEEAGFTAVSHRPLGPSDTLVTGTKPA